MSPRLVLLRPRNADNLGAVARAMKNFGLSDWVIVSPNPLLLDAPGLNRLAVRALDLLDSVRLVDSLEAAVADCVHVVGTTMRTVPGRRRLTPRQLAQEAQELGQAPWALVFGDERNGLTAEDLRQCHALSFIPTEGDQPSLNLAQAVVVYAHELSQARHPASSPPGPALATDAQLRRLADTLEAALVHTGFFWRDDRGALDNLVAPWKRARLSRQEADLWLAALASWKKD